MKASLDGIDGSVAERTHGTGDETDDGSLPAGKRSRLVLRLPDLQPILEVAVSSEVDGLVGTLSQRRQRHTAVQRTEPLLLDDSVERVGGVAVLGDIEGIGHGVVLRLEADLDDLHGGDDGDGLGHTGGETRQEDGLPGDLARLVGERLLVPFERGEADGHLGDDARQDGAQTLVQTEGGLPFDDFGTSLDEASFGSSGLARAAGELHSDLDCVFLGANVSFLMRGQLGGYAYREDGTREPPSYQHHHQL